MVFSRGLLWAAMAGLFALTLGFFSCGNGKKEPQNENGATAGESQSGPIKKITSSQQFDSIVAQAGDMLLVFDLYADWCMPCRILSPALEKIAERNLSKAAFYKINIDKMPQVAQSFGVRGIPHVALMKNGTVVDAIIGLSPEERYEKAIAEYAGK